jgi:hypothetical protein
MVSRIERSPQSPHGQLFAGAQVVNSFELKLFAIEAAIIIIVGLVAVIGRDDFVWLLR